MSYNISYTFTESEVTGGVEKVVSTIAARSLDQTGNSMYDSLRILSRDADEVKDHINESFGYLRTRLVDVCLIEDAGGDWEVNLNLPDWSGDESVMRADILRFVTRMASALWLETRHGEIAKATHDRAQEDLNSIARRAKTRKAPGRPS